MADTHGFGARIQQALLDTAARLGRRYTNVEFGAEVGKAERGRAYSSQAVGDWIAERREPTIATFKAMAKVTGKSVQWLMALDAQAPAEGSKGPPMYYGEEIKSAEKPAAKTGTTHRKR